LQDGEDQDSGSGRYGSDAPERQNQGHRCTDDGAADVRQ
jgi:hypothetical protein